MGLAHTFVPVGFPRTATTANSTLRHRSDHQSLFLPNLKIGITDRPFRANKQPRDQQKGETNMSERLETLKKARERMTEDRDAFAKTLAAPFDRDKAERARIKFIETQVLIDAIDRAIEGERTAPAAVV
jgi:hypothetical protein